MKTSLPLPVSEFGHTAELVGAVYHDYKTGQSHTIGFPDSPVESYSMDGWQQLLHQTDQLETEILAKTRNGELVKAVIRKCQRQIDAAISWKVYRRDGYACRYCGNASVPLTVDHLVLWEEGGPSIESNLVSSCRKCNKARGNTQYDKWLQSEHYSNASRGLAAEVRDLNASLVETLASIPRKYHVVSR